MTSFYFFVLIKYAKTSYFVGLDEIGIVGIQVEKHRGKTHEKYRGVPKGRVIKECDKGGVIKGTCIYSYQGGKNYIFYTKCRLSIIV